MIIVGLDLGTNTGYCVAKLKEGKLLNMMSGVNHFPTRDRASGLLFLEFEKWLTAFILSLAPANVEMVVAEKPHHRGGESTRKLVGLYAIFEKVCEGLGVKYADVHTGTLKKVCCGSGKAGKEEMIKFANRFFGSTPGNKKVVEKDDEADAMGVCYWAAKEFCDFKQKRRIKMRKLKTRKKGKKKSVAQEESPLSALSAGTKNQKKFVKVMNGFAEEFKATEIDIEKLFKGTKSAAPALRKKLMNIKNAAHELRQLALAIQKDI